MASNIKLNRICEYCGSEFVAFTTVTRYCSKKCNSKAYKVKERAGKVEESNKQTQAIKQMPMEAIKKKEFLSIADACALLGISRRTIYRLIERNELQTGKIGRRTIIRRADIDSLFEQPTPLRPIAQEPVPETVFEESVYYALADIYEKYNLSYRTVYDLIKRNGIKKIQRGKQVYVLKADIDSLLQ